MFKRSPTRRMDDLSSQSWSEKLRALGATLDAQKADLRDLCVLDLPEGFVVYAVRATSDGSAPIGVTYEFMLDELAPEKQPWWAR